MYMHFLWVTHDRSGAERRLFALGDSLNLVSGQPLGEPRHHFSSSTPHQTIVQTFEHTIGDPLNELFADIW